MMLFTIKSCDQETQAGLRDRRGTYWTGKYFGPRAVTCFPFAKSPSTCSCRKEHTKVSIVSWSAKRKMGPTTQFLLLLELLWRNKTMPRFSGATKQALSVGWTLQCASKRKKWWQGARMKVWPWARAASDPILAARATHFLSPPLACCGSKTLPRGFPCILFYYFFYWHFKFAFWNNSVLCPVFYHFLNHFSNISYKYLFWFCTCHVILMFFFFSIQIFLASAKSKYSVLLFHDFKLWSPI